MKYIIGNSIYKIKTYHVNEDLTQMKFKKERKKTLRVLANDSFNRAE
jgi:hypothetical protein